MTNKITRTLKALWSTKKGKAAIFLAAFLVVALTVLVVGGALVNSRHAPAGHAASRTPGHAANPSDPGTGSSDLFATSGPTRTGSPQPSADGTVDIGGPGIPANTNTLVNPDAPETTPDPSTGLAAFPAPVPHSKLTVPLEQRWTVQQCASSRVPEARAYANQLIGYLFTFDTGRADWSDFVTPLHDTWNETVGGYGNGPDQKETPGSSWDNRISSLGYAGGPTSTGSPAPVAASTGAKAGAAGSAGGAAAGGAAGGAAAAAGPVGIAAGAAQVVKAGATKAREGFEGAADAAGNGMGTAPRLARHRPEEGAGL